MKKQTDVPINFFHFQRRVSDHFDTCLIIIKDVYPNIIKNILKLKFSSSKGFVRCHEPVWTILR